MQIRSVPGSEPTDELTEIRLQVMQGLSGHRVQVNLQDTHPVYGSDVVGMSTLTAVAEFSYDYTNGYVDNAGNAQGSDDPLYRIYSITQGNTTSEDYLNWPANQGAYVDSAGKPLSLGTQTMFYVYTDAYPHGSGLQAYSH